MTAFAMIFTLALGWLATPGFLWWGLGLASIPIIIHILNRRRYRIVLWAAMEYLLQALRKNRRRIKFEQLLLLATRCALLALLGLALARPQGCSKSSVAALAGQRSALHIFIIDNSYPMGYQSTRADASTHLEQAKLLAKQQMAKLTGGSESVAVILASRQPRTPPVPGKSDQPTRPDPVILHPSYRLDVGSAAVESIQQSYDGGDLAGALQSALRLVRDEDKQPETFVYILTSFANSTWAKDAEIIRQTGKELANVLGPNHIRIHNLGVPGGQWNYAVLDVRPEGAIARAKLDTDFLAEVRGYGGGDGTRLSWMWDREILRSGGGGFIRPGPDSPPQRQRKADLSSGGIHVIAASVNDESDHLPADNVHYRVVEIASELKVLIVEGSREGGAASLDLALAPKKEKSATGTVRSDSYLAPESIGELDFGNYNRRLGEYRVLILSGVGTLSDSQLDEVKTFVQQGGTLMTFMGEATGQEFCNKLSERKLLPGKVVSRRTASSATGYTLDFRPNSSVHPLLQIFKGEEQTGLNTASIEKYCQLDVDPQSQADVVLRYLDGEKETNDPAILVHALGAGRIVSVTTTDTSEWNTLPLKPCYVELIHELLAGTIDIGDRWMNVSVGDCLQVPVAMDLTDLPRLTDSNDENPQAMKAINTPDGKVLYRSEPIARPGLYKLSYQSRTGPDVRYVAVNVPSDQGDVSLLPPAAIKKAMGDIDLEMLGDAAPIAGLSRRDRSDLGWFMMVLVLVLAGAECFMAMHFGHYRRKAPIEAPVEVASAAASAQSSASATQVAAGEP